MADDGGKNKKLVGHHLLRVRIRESIFHRLQSAADDESARTGENITVSDLVRQACVQYLALHETVARLSAVAQTTKLSGNKPESPVTIRKSDE